VKKRYANKLEKYLERIEAEISVNSVSAGAGDGAGEEFTKVASGALGGGLVGGLAGAGAIAGAVAVPALSAAFAAIPALSIGALAIPGIGVILAGIGAVIGGFMNMGKKGESKEQNIRRQLQSEVFPGILRRIGANLEDTLMKNTENIENIAAEEIAAQRRAQEKALEENRTQQNLESEEREKRLRKAKEDLARAEALLLPREEAPHAE
jgi:hypothetical protein